MRRSWRRPRSSWSPSRERSTRWSNRTKQYFYINLGEWIHCQQTADVEEAGDHYREGQRPAHGRDQLDHRQPQSTCSITQFRIGATGKERINTLNEYYRQILNISFPALHRYMLWTASEQKHLFGQESADSTDQDAWFRELEDTLTLTE